MGLETLRPSADGDYTNLGNQLGYPPNYVHVDEQVPDDGATWVFIESLTQVKDAYQLADTAIPEGALISSVTAYFRVQGNNQKYYQPFLRLGGVETAGTEVLPSGTNNYTTFSEALSRPGGGSWQVSDLNNLQVCIGLRSKLAGHYCRCTQVYVEIGYTVVTARSSSDAGEGAEAKVTGYPFATSAGVDNGSGAEAAVLLIAKSSSETGSGAEASSLEKDMSVSDGGRGSDSLAARTERPVREGGMKLWI